MRFRQKIDNIQYTEASNYAVNEHHISEMFASIFVLNQPFICNALHFLFFYFYILNFEKKIAEKYQIIAENLSIFPQNE